MFKDIFRSRQFLIFLAKFVLVFCLCYYGTLAVIGLSAENGYYVPFINKYLDYVTWIRKSLLYGTEFFLNVRGIDTYLASEYNLRMVNGRGIIVGLDCVGYGIMSFWAAFIVASAGTFKRKMFWLIVGFLFFWILNVLRMYLLFIATNKGWPMPLGWDHHTWFNVTTYIVILVMIYYIDKTSSGKGQIPEQKKHAVAGNSGSTSFNNV